MRLRASPSSSRCLLLWAG
ncbi:hypothetical protein SEA_JESSIBETH14_265 [Mycobacterium phage Jessibeth14]|nr:hypothetical protein SEA_JESSIBETH14_265 [Mycobacterium phage Jessibeth14]